MNAETPAATPQSSYAEDVALATMPAAERRAWNESHGLTGRTTHLQTRHIFLGVFLGLWAWSITGGILWEIFH